VSEANHDAFRPCLRVSSGGCDFVTIQVIGRSQICYIIERSWGCWGCESSETMTRFDLARRISSDSFNLLSIRLLLGFFSWRIWETDLQLTPWLNLWFQMNQSSQIQFRLLSRIISAFIGQKFALRNRILCW
jgi:hypothetical protein